MFDPTDPSNLTSEQRLDELTAVLATRCGAGAIPARRTDRMAMLLNAPIR